MVDADETCWGRQFDWEGLLNRSIAAPITFSLKGEDDTVRASPPWILRKAIGFGSRNH
jgi:hypothetical protein